ncbi:MAG: hypothetical protein ACXVFV_08360 [Mycobacteriales bacterium]
MTAPQHVAETAKDEAAQVSATAAQQGREVAGTAKAAGSDVAGTAHEQAANVVGETMDQARQLASSVRSTVDDQVSSQSERLTGVMRSVSSQLREGDTSGMVGQVLKEAGQRLQQLADHAESRGPQGLVDDLRLLARRRPGTFLLSAAAAGLLAGRLTRGLAAGSSGTSSAGTGSQQPGGTASGQPLAGVTTAPDTGLSAGYTTPLDAETSHAPGTLADDLVYPPEPAGAETALPTEGYGGLR